MGGTIINTRKREKKKDRRRQIYRYWMFFSVQSLTDNGLVLIIMAKQNVLLPQAEFGFTVFFITHFTVHDNRSMGIKTKF